MPSPSPDITVAVPCRNGGTLLRRALAQVFAQEIDRPFEVLAFDSGSTDGTLDALAEHPVRVIPIDQDTFDWGRLRERMFEESRGAIMVSLSQDAVPAGTDWLARLVAPLDDPEVGVSCGSSIPDPDRDFPQFQWEKNGYYYFTREIGKFTARYGKGLSFANTAVRRAVWEALRIEPQATGEDFGFQMKLHAAGVPIAFPSDAPVLHHHNYTLKGVYRRCRNEGLALREMGCAYHEGDLLADLASPKKYIQWLREVKRGSLRNGAEWCYPRVAPDCGVYGQPLRPKNGVVLTMAKDSIQKFYRDNPRMVSSPFGGVDGINDALLTDVLTRLNIDFAQKRVLDVGCGRGYVEDVVKAQGGTYIGADFVISRGGFPLVRADAACLPFPDNSMDVLLCIDASEHFPQPAQVAREFFRVLKPGGVYFLSAPNYGNVAGLVKKLYEGLGWYEKDTWAPFGRWQPQELEQPLTPGFIRKIYGDAGFAPITGIGHGAEVGLGLFPWVDHPKTPEAIQFRLQRLFAALGPGIAQACPTSSLHIFWRMEKPPES